MQNQTLIETKNISKVFKDRKVIDNLSLTVEEGDIFGFLGPSGSGKTTTIRMILGLLFPNEGEVFLNGYNINKDLTKALATVGAIVENPSFYTYLSGRDNLKLAANLYPEIKEDRIDQVLELVKLKDRAKDKVKTYTLGMKQRLGIAMALLNNPKLIILDEPTNGLDPQGMREIREVIIQLAKEHKITFFISSRLLYEVEQICTKVAILKDGKLLVQGDVKDILTSETDAVEISTSDNSKAFKLLKELDFVRSVNLVENKIEIDMEKGNYSKLNKIFVLNEVEINYISQLGNSLEKLFSDLTEGGRKAC